MCQTRGIRRTRGQQAENGTKRQDGAADGGLTEMRINQERTSLAFQSRWGALFLFAGGLPQKGIRMVVNLNAEKFEQEVIDEHSFTQIVRLQKEKV